MRSMRLGDKTGALIGSWSVHPGDEILVISARGRMVRLGAEAGDARAPQYRRIAGIGSVDTIRDRVRRVVLHEVAHHFGFGEERLRELGLG